MRHGWLVSLSLVAIGCVSDPRDPQTWIKKLDSPVEQKDAVRELAHLKDPVAVPPLVAFYKKNHDPEVLKAIATFKSKDAIPVIIVSAYGTLMNEQDAHQAVGVIQKPFDYDDLVGQVERATARNLAVALT